MDRLDLSMIALSVCLWVYIIVCVKAFVRRKQFGSRGVEINIIRLEFLEGL